MDAHGITREHVMLTPDMVRKLNEDEHTQVLEYEYDTPEKLLSMQDVARVLEQVRRAHAALRAQEPGLTDAELRTRLVDGCADVAVFSRTHPTIFVKLGHWAIFKSKGVGENGPHEVAERIALV